MFNNEVDINELERRIKSLEYKTDFYTQTGTLPVNTVLHLLVKHLKLELLDVPSSLVFKEASDDETKA